jgi:hypothetical protein
MEVAVTPIVARFEGDAGSVDTSEDVVAQACEEGVSSFFVIRPNKGLTPSYFAKPISHG